ncbi:MAG TPA: glycosyltransferase family 39 protein, partial [Streptosporangiaceae bacterium]
MAYAVGAGNHHAGRHAAQEFRPVDVALPVISSAGTTMTRRAAPPLWLVPPSVTLAIMLWGIRSASYSRDESATMAAVQRPFHGLVRMLVNVDAVHGVYYVIMWPVVRLLGPGELATRLPSALAMAAAAAAIFGVGQRLVSTRAGLAAGLVFAILPPVSLYGQTARPYAMATALAAIASYLLVRAMQAAAAGDNAAMRGWLTCYGVCLAALGYMHMFGLLVAAAHVAPVTRFWSRHAGDRTGKSLAIGWLGVVAGALAVASAVVIAGLGQRSALTWLKPRSLAGLTGLTSLIGPRAMAAAAGAVILCAIGVDAVAGRARLRADWPGDFIALCVPWLILPATILIVASSLVTPVYVFRYVVFCTPA